MDPYTFVRNLTLGPRLEQACSLPAAELANPFDLDPDLNVAVRHGFRIQPVLAKKISRCSLTVGPESSVDQIAFWAKTHKGCNWVLALEESGFLALRIDPYRSLDAIAWIGHKDGHDWQRTLQFRLDGDYYALFARPAEGFRDPGTSFPGLTVISRERLLVPPSTHYPGISLNYTDRRAPILVPPTSLFRPSPFGQRDAADLASAR